LIVWFILLVRNVTSICFVRYMLKVEKDQRDKELQTLIQIIGAIYLYNLVQFYHFSWLLAVGYGVIFLRAMVGINSVSQAPRPQTIGVREVVYGLINSACVILSFIFPTFL